MSVDLAGILRLLHGLAAFWLVAGLAGRWVALSLAARESQIQPLAGLMRAAEIFEQRMVVPASTVVFVAGLVTAWAQGRPILGFLQGAGSNWLLLSLVLYLSLTPLIILVLNPRRRARQLALERAVEKGEVTPELHAALRDGTVRAARFYEWAVMLVILVLMFTKPF